MRIDEVPKPPTWIRMYEQITQDRSKDPVDKVTSDVKGATKPKLEEPALVHPFNTSTVKIKNNGMIDIWVATDQGIRLDPNTRTLNFIVDGIKEHVNYARSWIVEDVGCWAKKGFLFNSEHGGLDFSVGANIKLSAGKDMELIAGGKITIKAQRIDFIKG